MKTLCLLLAFTSPALAGSIMFGASWDGNPPGTFADIAGGGDFESGHADFAAGTWIITVDGGYSAWVGRDVVGFEGDTFCATAANPCALGGVGTVLQVYQDRPWHLWATTPSYTHLTSNGPQFAFTQTSQTSWRWGLEDITLGASDNDYQDVFGTIRFVSRATRPDADAAMCELRAAADTCARAESAVADWRGDAILGASHAMTDAELSAALDATAAEIAQERPIVFKGKPFIPDRDRVPVERMMKLYLAANPGMTSNDFTAPPELFDAVEEAFTRWPKQDEHGEWFFARINFCDPKEPRQHMLFKAVHCFRGEHGR